MSKIISFPHIGSYYIPVKYFFSNITNQEILVPPPITKKTKNLGCKYSPDFVCVPFKYNLGNYIEALEQKANILVQAGGGCRYGYYAELQEQILRDLGYKFTFVNFIHNNHVSIFKIYKFAKQQNHKLNIFKYFYYLISALTILVTMDLLDKYYRKLSPFEEVKSSFKQQKTIYEKKLLQTTGIIKTISLYFKYKKIYKNIKINKPSNHLKVVMLGELYSLMEPYSSYNIEQKLMDYNVEITRHTTMTYLLLQKKFKLRYYLYKARHYIKYHLGADATESVALTLKYAKKKYDGIVHIKSFGCTPELNATSILDKISSDYDIPVVHFSFDASDSETGMITRIEAFYDMLINKRNSR
ncbi:MAG: 2-hydroxyacyl-CoA dehydratase [bacterium]|nr:2-hydroxyacyl-CoA dehydratase [bacterium]